MALSLSCNKIQRKVTKKEPSPSAPKQGDVFYPQQQSGDSALALTYVIVAIGQIQRRLILHVAQHCVSARLAQDVGNGSVPSPHREMQGGAAIKHGSVHIGPPAEQQLHRRDVAQLHGKMESRFPACSFLWWTQMGNNVVKFYTGWATSREGLLVEAADYGLWFWLENQGGWRGLNWSGRHGSTSWMSCRCAFHPIPAGGCRAFIYICVQ